VAKFFLTLYYLHSFAQDIEENNFLLGSWVVYDEMIPVCHEPVSNLMAVLFPELLTRG